VRAPEDESLAVNQTQSQKAQKFSMSLCVVCVLTQSC
jgi:hypothetical protein